MPKAYIFKSGKNGHRAELLNTVELSDDHMKRIEVFREKYMLPNRWGELEESNGAKSQLTNRSIELKRDHQ